MKTNCVIQLLLHTERKHLKCYLFVVVVLAKLYPNVKPFSKY